MTSEEMTKFPVSTWQEEPGTLWGFIWHLHFVMRRYFCLIHAICYTEQERVPGGRSPFYLAPSSSLSTSVLDAIYCRLEILKLLILYLRTGLADLSRKELIFFCSHFWAPLYHETRYLPSSRDSSKCRSLFLLISSWQNISITGWLWATSKWIKPRYATKAERKEKTDKR